MNFFLILNLVILFSSAFYKEPLTIDPSKENENLSSFLARINDPSYTLEEFINSDIVLDFKHKLEPNNYSFKEAHSMIDRLKKVFNSTEIIVESNINLTCSKNDGFDFNKKFTKHSRKFKTNTSKLVSFYDFDRISDIEASEKASEETSEEYIKRIDKEFFELAIYPRFYNSLGFEYYSNKNRGIDHSDIYVDIYEATHKDVKISNDLYTYAFFIVDPGVFYDRNQTVKYTNPFTYEYRNKYNYFIYMCSYNQLMKIGFDSVLCSKYIPNDKDIEVNNNTIKIKGNYFNCTIGNLQK